MTDHATTDGRSVLYASRGRGRGLHQSRDCQALRQTDTGVREVPADAYPQEWRERRRCSKCWDGQDGQRGRQEATPP